MKIELSHISVADRVRIMECLEVGTVVANLQKELDIMEYASKEYQAMQKLVKNSGNRKEEFFDKVWSHIGKPDGIRIITW